MVINGLSNKRRLPRIGKVRIGEKAVSEKSGKEYPRAIDHFIFDAEDEQMNKVAEEVCGKDSKVINITFPFDDMDPFDNVFPQYYMCYKGSRGCVCKGDGIKAVEVREDGTLNDEKVCPCAKIDSKECRAVASLQFSIHNFPALGVWQLDTGSKNSIININSALALTRQVVGRISGVPFRLSIEPQSATVDGKKKNVFVLHLRAVGVTGNEKKELVAEPVAAQLVEDTKAQATPAVEEFTSDIESNSPALENVRTKPGCISEIEARMIFTKAKALRITESEVRMAMKKSYGKERTLDLTPSERDDLMAWMNEYIRLREEEAAKEENR